MIHDHSLAETVDAINDVLFYDQSLSKTQVAELITWLCNRQEKNGNNQGLFTPTLNDYKNCRLFTGERLKTRLATRKILTQEISRALILFGVSSVEIQETLRLATTNMLTSCYARDYCTQGECRHQFVGFMRYLNVVEISDRETRLEKHIEILKQHRDGKGKWKGFPFHYTLLVLSEIELLSAYNELQYAVPASEGSLKRTSIKDKFSQRRREVIRKVLARIQEYELSQPQSGPPSLTKWIKQEL